METRCITYRISTVVWGANQVVRNFWYRVLAFTPIPMCKNQSNTIGPMEIYQSCSVVGYVYVYHLFALYWRVSRNTQPTTPLRYIYTITGAFDSFSTIGIKKKAEFCTRKCYTPESHPKRWRKLAKYATFVYRAEDPSGSPSANVPDNKYAC